MNEKIAKLQERIKLHSEKAEQLFKEANELQQESLNLTTAEERTTAIKQVIILEQRASTELHQSRKLQIELIQEQREEFHKQM